MRIDQTAFSRSDRKHIVELPRAAVRIPMFWLPEAAQKLGVRPRPPLADMYRLLGWNFLSGPGIERAGGTVHRRGDHATLANAGRGFVHQKSLSQEKMRTMLYKYSACGGVLRVLRAGCRWAIQFNGRRARNGHLLDYRSGLAEWNRTRLVVSYDLPRLGENL